MARKKIVAGNWKMNMTPSQAVKLVEAVSYTHLDVYKRQDYSKIRMTYQEYFRRMNEDPKRWSQPFAALLGACLLYTSESMGLHFSKSSVYWMNKNNA